MVGTVAARARENREAGRRGDLEKRILGLVPRWPHGHRLARDALPAPPEPRTPRPPAPPLALAHADRAGAAARRRLQAQYAPSPYIRLWSMLDRFELARSRRALEKRRAVQGTLMRSTIHIVSPRDYWRFSAGIGPRAPGVVAAGLGTRGPRARPGRGGTFAEGRARRPHVAAEGARRAAAEKGSTIWSGAWVELVRVPPSGTWERRRADLFQLAGEWLPPERVTEVEGLEHLSADTSARSAPPD